VSEPTGIERSAEFGRLQKLVWSKARYLAERYGYKSHIHVILMALEAFEEALEKMSHVREEEESV